MYINIQVNTRHLSGVLKMSYYQQTLFSRIDWHRIK